METFASKEKRQTPATSKSHHYLHHPIDPVQQVQQAAIRKILRPDEVQAKSDIGENDGKYKQETDRVADEVMRIPEPQVHSDSRKGIGIDSNQVAHRTDYSIGSKTG